jgi:phage-related protein
LDSLNRTVQKNNAEEATSYAAAKRNMDQMAAARVKAGTATTQYRAQTEAARRADVDASSAAERLGRALDQENNKLMVNGRQMKISADAARQLQRGKLQLEQGSRSLRSAMLSEMQANNQAQAAASRAADAERAVRGALVDRDTALRRVNSSVREYGATSEQARSAVTDLHNAETRLSRATSESESAAARAARTEINLSNVRSRVVRGTTDLSNATKRVHSDMNAAESGAGLLGRALDKIAGNSMSAGQGLHVLGAAFSFVKIPVFVFWIQQALSAVSALGAGLVSLASAIGPAFSAVAALPSIVGALGGAFAAVKLGTSGVGAAIQAYGQQQTQNLKTTGSLTGAQKQGTAATKAGTAAAQQGTSAGKDAIATKLQERQAAESLASAQRGVTDAQHSLNEARYSEKQAVQSVSDAERSLTEARYSERQAVLSVSDAEHSLAEAQYSQRQAQMAVTQARQQAIVNIDTLKNSIKEEQLAERGATLSLAEARQNLVKVLNDPGSTALDRAQARLAVDQAKQSLADTKKQSKDTQKQYQQASKQGVEGSQAVKDAEHQNAQAAYATKQAVQGVADAQHSRAQAEQAVQQAVRGVTDAEHSEAQAAYAVKQAALQVKLAQQQLIDTRLQNAEAAKQQAAADVQAGQAATQGGAAGADAMNAYQAAMAKLTPAQRRLVTAILDLKDKFQQVKTATAEAMAPGLITAIKNVEGLIPTLKKGLSDVGRAVGGAAAHLSGMLDTNRFKKNLGDLLSGSAPIIRKVGDALGHIVNAFVSIGVQAQPFTNWIATTVDGWTKLIDKTTEGSEKTGRLANYLKTVVKPTLQTLGTILKNVGIGLFNMGHAARGSGDSLLKSIANITGKWAKWTQSVGGQNKMKQYFDNARETIKPLVSLIGAVLKLFGRLSQIKGTGQMFQTMKDELVPALENLIKSFQGDLGKKLIDFLANLMNIVAKLGTSSTGAVVIFVQAMSVFAGILLRIMQIKGVTPILSGLVTVLAAFKAIKLVGAITGMTGMARAARAFMGKDYGKEASGVEKFFTAWRKGASGAGEGMFKYAAGVVKTGAGLAALKVQETAKSLSDFSKKAWEAASNSKLAGLATKAWAGIQKAFNVVMDFAAANPWVIAIAAIVAVIVILLVKFHLLMPILKAIGKAFEIAFQAVAKAAKWVWDGIKAVWDKVWPFLKTWGPLALTALAPMIGIPLLIFQHWKQIWAWMQKIWDWLVNFFKKWGTTILAILFPFITIPVLFIVKYWNNIVKFFQGIWNWLFAFFKKWGPLILTLIFPFLGLPLLIWQHWKQISGWLKKVWDAVVNVFKKVWETIKSWFTTMWNWVKGVFIKWWQGIVKLFKGPWDAVVGVFKNVWKTLKDWFSTAWNWVKGVFAKWWAGIKAIFKGPFDAVVGALKTIWNTIKGWFVTAWNWVKGVFKTWWNGVKDILRGPLDAFKNVMGTIWNGIKTGFTKAIGGITNAAKTAWDVIQKIFESPVYYVVKYAYEDGIRWVWNKIPGLHDLPSAQGFLSKLKHFAGGGMVPGYAPGRDTVPAMLSPGEAVLRPEVARQIGPSRIRSWNRRRQAFAEGGVVDSSNVVGGGLILGTAAKAMFAPGVPVQHAFLGLEHVVSAFQSVGHAIGNVVNGAIKIGGQIIHFANPMALFNWVKDKMNAIGDKFKELIAKFANNEFGQAIIKMPAEMIGKAISWAKDKIINAVKSFFGFGGDVGSIPASAKGIWTGLTRLGFSEAASAGIMGNMKDESSFNPFIIQGGGTSKNPSDAGGGGYGLVQWTPGSKLSAILHELNLKNSMASQLEALAAQLAGKTSYSEAQAGNNLKGAKDPQIAANIFGLQYERYSTGDSRTRSSAANAQAIYRQFAKGTAFKAEGGIIPGYGWGDTVPAMLTPGEFVIRKDAVRAIGQSNLERMNAQHFHSGGPVKGWKPGSSFNANSGVKWQLGMRAWQGDHWSKDLTAILKKRWPQYHKPNDNFLPNILHTMRKHPKADYEGLIRALKWQDHRWRIGEAFAHFHDWFTLHMAKSIEKQKQGKPIEGPRKGKWTNVPERGGKSITKENVVQGRRNRQDPWHNVRYENGKPVLRQHVFEGFIKGKPGKAGDSRTVSRTQDWLRRTVNPLPYQMGTVGPRMYDCSGLAGAVVERITGKGSGRIFTTRNEGGVLRQYGFKAGAGKANRDLVIGWANTSRLQHTTGSLAGLKFEARGDIGIPLKDQIIIGSGAKPPTTFPHVMHLPLEAATKGTLAPGWVRIGKDWRTGKYILRDKDNKRKYDKTRWKWEDIYAVTRTVREGKPIYSAIRNVDKPVDPASNRSNKLHHLWTMLSTQKKNVAQAIKAVQGRTGMKQTGAWFEGMDKPVRHILMHGLKMNHDYALPHPWSGQVTALEKAISNQIYQNKKTAEWNAALTKIAEWGLPDLLQWLEDKGQSEGLQIAQEATKNRSQAIKLNATIKKNNALTGDITTAQGVTFSRADILKAVGYIASAKVTNPRSLRQMATYMQVSDYVIVNMYDTLVKQMGKAVPSGKYSKLTADVNLFRKGLFYAAQGGTVPGHGSGDTVPAMLTPGEFVLRKDAVRALGVNRVNNLNRFDAFQHFALGGFVSPAISTSPARGAPNRSVSGGSNGPESVTYHVEIHNPSITDAGYSVTKALQLKAATGQFDRSPQRFRFVGANPRQAS